MAGVCPFFRHSQSGDVIEKAPTWVAEQCKAEMRNRRFRAAKAEEKLEAAQKAYVATECDNLRAAAARMIAKGGASKGTVFMKNAQALHEWLKVEKANNPQHWLNPLRLRTSRGNSETV